MNAQQPAPAQPAQPDPQPRRWAQTYGAISDTKVQFLAEALQKLGYTVKKAWPLARAARRLGLPFEDWNDEYSKEDTRFWLNIYIDDLEAEVAAEKKRWADLHGKKARKASS